MNLRQTNYTKLFGVFAQRVNNKEMNIVFNEIYEKLNFKFKYIYLNDCIKCKKDHGDIDILILNEGLDFLKEIKELLGNQVIKTSNNKPIYSILFESKGINKTVHVDFITSNNIDLLNCNRQYYRLNDFSYLIGIVSKKNDFKFGTEGFFKRFKDSKSNWHNYLITQDLNLGLQMLGYDYTKINDIVNYMDVIRFVSSSDLFDYKFFNFKNLNSRDRRSTNKRKLSKILAKKLFDTKIEKIQIDKDFYFKSFYPNEYEQYCKFKQNIIDYCYSKNNKYNGKWIIETLNIKEGPLVGKCLKSIDEKYGKQIEFMCEKEVIEFLKEYINSLQLSLKDN